MLKNFAVTVGLVFALAATPGRSFANDENDVRDFIARGKVKMEWRSATRHPMKKALRPVWRDADPAESMFAHAR
jgi:hypothetical protein